MIAETAYGVKKSIAKRGGSVVNCQLSVVGNRGALRISAKLFCKNSQAAIMPYGIDLKDERPTSNEKTNIQYRTFH